MPIHVHISRLSDKTLLEKLGVERRAKPRELGRRRQVILIKWVRSVKDAYRALKLLYTAQPLLPKTKTKWEAMTERDQEG